MKTVILHGILGKKFGLRYTFEATTVAEVVSALTNLVPGFTSFLRDSEKLGICYNIRTGKRHYSEAELCMNCSGDVIDIRPIVIGSKRQGTGQVIAGVVLIVVGAVIRAYGGPGEVLIKLGVSLLVGGALQLLFTPEGIGSQNEEEKKRSYLFSGIAGTTRQGGPVPVGYGRMIVGPQVVSAGATTVDIDIVDPRDERWVDSNRPPGYQTP